MPRSFFGSIVTQLQQLEEIVLQLLGHGVADVQQDGVVHGLLGKRIALFRSLYQDVGGFHSPYEDGGDVGGFHSHYRGVGG